MGLSLPQRNLAFYYETDKTIKDILDENRNLKDKVAKKTWELERNRQTIEEYKRKLEYQDQTIKSCPGLSYLGQ